MTNTHTSTADILARFDSFDITTEQRTAMAANRDRFKELAARILATTKPGREQSSALTALEEAKYWSNQSIALSGLPPRVNEDTAPANLDILSLPIEQGDLPETPTLGAYLAELLITLVAEGEGFDAKRPFGNSDWEDCITEALDNAGGDELNWQDVRVAIKQALTALPAVVASLAEHPNFEEQLAQEFTEVNAIVRIGSTSRSFKKLYPNELPDSAIQTIADEFVNFAGNAIISMYPTKADR